MPRSAASTSSACTTIRAGAGEYLPAGPDRGLPGRRRQRPGLQRPERQRHARLRAIPAWPTGRLTFLTPPANFVASQMTDANGNFNIQGLAPGTYTVSEVVQAGWTADGPAASGHLHRHRDRGQRPSRACSSATSRPSPSAVRSSTTSPASGSFQPGDPGLPGWTIDLLDCRGRHRRHHRDRRQRQLQLHRTSAPARYTVQEELQAGWIQTFPAPPGTYTVTATSGSDQTGLLFGNFQLVTFAGTVYNDLNGDGVHRAGRAGPAGLDGQPARRDAATSWPPPRAPPTAPTASRTSAQAPYTIAGGHPGRLVSRPSPLLRAPTPCRPSAARTPAGSTSATSSS